MGPLQLLPTAVSLVWTGGALAVPDATVTVSTIAAHKKNTGLNAFRGNTDPTAPMVIDTNCNHRVGVEGPQLCIGGVARPDSTY